MKETEEKTTPDEFINHIRETFEDELDNCGSWDIKLRGLSATNVERVQCGNCGKNFPLRTAIVFARVCVLAGAKAPLAKPTKPEHNNSTDEKKPREIKVVTPKKKEKIELKKKDAVVLSAEKINDLLKPVEKGSKAKESRKGNKNKLCLIYVEKLQRNNPVLLKKALAAKIEGENAGDILNIDFTGKYTEIFMIGLVHAKWNPVFGEKKKMFKERMKNIHKVLSEELHKCPVKL